MRTHRTYNLETSDGPSILKDERTSTQNVFFCFLLNNKVYLLEEKPRTFLALAEIRAETYAGHCPGFQNKQTMRKKIQDARGCVLSEEHQYTTIYSHNKCLFSSVYFSAEWAAVVTVCLFRQPVMGPETVIPVAPVCLSSVVLVQYVGKKSSHTEKPTCVSRLLGPRILQRSAASCELVVSFVFNIHMSGRSE